MDRRVKIGSQFKDWSIDHLAGLDRENEILALYFVSGDDPIYFCLLPTEEEVFDYKRKIEVISEEIVIAEKCLS
jgi:hypothetical protein